MKKEDYIKWCSKEDLTIDEASYLWFDVDPDSLEGLTHEIALKISIIKEKLKTEGGLSKKIWHKDTGEFLDINKLLNIQGRDRYIIDIESLKEYAESIGQRPKFLFFEDIEEQSGLGQKNTIFPCQEGTKWEDIEITLIADDTVRIKTPKGKEKFTYHELELSDKRKGDTPTILWNLLKFFLKNKGFISSQNPDYNTKLPDNVKRLNKHLQNLFSINDSILTGHYKKEKGYKINFKCYDRTYSDNTPEEQFVTKKPKNKCLRPDDIPATEGQEDTELDPSQNRPRY